MVCTDQKHPQFSRNLDDYAIVVQKNIKKLVEKQQILIQKTLVVLSLLRPIVHDTSKTAKITWFILVLHWAMDVI